MTGKWQVLFLEPGDCKPGGILGRRDSLQGRMPLALVGKVYRKADAQYGPIEVGDLLTTSTTPGHGMRAADPVKAFGAVIGKALGRLGWARSKTKVIPLSYFKLAAANRGLRRKPCHHHLNIPFGRNSGNSPS